MHIAPLLSLLLLLLLLLLDGRQSGHRPRTVLAGKEER
jgi:hypothetical protein